MSSLEFFCGLKSYCKYMFYNGITKYKREEEELETVLTGTPFLSIMLVLARNTTSRFLMTVAKSC